MSEKAITGAIMRLDTDFIQIAPFLGFWLTQTQYDDISQRYHVGDTITIYSENDDGLVTAIEDKA